MAHGTKRTADTDVDILAEAAVSSPTKRIKKTVSSPAVPKGMVPMSELMKAVRYDVAILTWRTLCYVISQTSGWFPRPLPPKFMVSLRKRFNEREMRASTKYLTVRDEDGYRANMKQYRDALEERLRFFREAVAIRKEYDGVLTEYLNTPPMNPAGSAKYFKVTKYMEVIKRPTQAGNKSMAYLKSARELFSTLKKNNVGFYRMVLVARGRRATV